jgi:hypothetical protein
MSVTVREPITGVNGVNKLFDTSQEYKTGTLNISRNGQQLLGDFQELGGTQFEMSYPPKSSDFLLAEYEVDLITGFINQETTWKTNVPFYFKHIADTGLTVNIRIYDSSNGVEILGLNAMTEEQPGVYSFTYMPTSVGNIYAVMQDTANLTTTVHELHVDDIDLQDIKDQLDQIQQGNIGKPRIECTNN